MPMWNVYVPEGTYSEEDKQGFAAAVTDLYEEYAGLPRFYVTVVFHDQPRGTMFTSGVPTENFVRIVMVHGARISRDDAALSRWMQAVHRQLDSYLCGRGLMYEAHGDEVPRVFWTIDGIAPPQPHSQDELRWKAENKPSALTGA